MSINLNNQKKAGLFKYLATHSLHEAGMEFGFDKYYKTNAGMKNAVYKIYREVHNDPEKFCISLDTVDLVAESMSNRAVAKPNPSKPTLKEQAELSKDIKELSLSTRDQAANLLFRKMDMIGSSRKKLDDVSLSVLATTFGILFDKAQIIQGQATENVAVLAKIDKDMTPEESLDFILKVREINVSDKDK